MVLEKIVGALGRAVLTAAGGEVMARPTNAVLDVLLRSNAEQLAVLKRIDQRVDDLVRGPFNTGLVWLKEASKPRRAARRGDDLAKAREAFIEALGNETRDPARNAVIRAYLAVIAHADGDYVGAEDYLEEAHDALCDGYSTSMREKSLLASLRYSHDLDEALAEYFEAVADLRVALGAHPSCVPRYRLLGPSLIARHRGNYLEVDRWLERAQWRSMSSEPPGRVSTYTPDRDEIRLASRPVRGADGRLRHRRGLPKPTQQEVVGRRLVEIWLIALPTRTDDLVDVALGGSEWTMLKRTFHGTMDPVEWRRVATDMAADRRRGWPLAAKRALPPDVQSTLWPDGLHPPHGRPERFGAHARSSLRRGDRH